MYSREEAVAASLVYFDGDNLAANVFVDKYALKDNDGNILEDTPDKMHDRLAKEFARIEQKYPNPLSYEEIRSAFDKFKYIVPQGSPMEGIGNDFRITSLSNCFVIPSPEDSYGGIMKADQQEAQLMKRRGGVGIDLSKIRPKGLPTNNAAKTTDGIEVFMDRFSNTCREVAQNGRRGALMQSLDISHLQAEDFIKIKQDTARVTGANISVKLNDKFMNAVKNDTEFTQQWPVDSSEPVVTKNIKAKELWNTLIHSAWKSAEPGILFWDNVKKNTPADIYSDEGFGSVSTNPCLVGTTMVKVRDVYGNESYKSIEEISNNSNFHEWFNIHDGKSWILNSKFRKTGDNEPIFKISMECGDIECTIGHKHNTNYGKLSTKDIIELIDNGKEVFLKTINTIHHNGKCECWNTQICSITPTNTYADVYCTTVDTTNNFVIGVVVTGGDVYTDIVTGNCGEINLSPADSCRLISLNLLSFVVDKFLPTAYFDFEKMGKYAYNAQRLMDDMIDLELEKIDQIIEKIKNDPESESVKREELELWELVKTACRNGRRTGLGITALGDAIAAIGIRYGSEESIEMTEKVYKTLSTNAYKSTIDMAETRGSFPVFNYDKEKTHEFVSRIVGELGPEYILKWKQFGRRNIALTTTAPTGTVSLMTQTTSGIEPCFMPVYKRRKKIQNSTDSIDFVDDNGDKWQEFEVCHHQFSEWRKISGKTNVEDSPYYKATSMDIDWVAGVDLQASAQRWVCHSISRTANIPNDAPESLVSDIYMKAWESGCKGYTVYRDGCRAGVLISTDSKPNASVFETKDAPKRPDILSCGINQVKIKNDSWTVLVGLMEDKPYEIFAGLSKFVSIPKSLTKGQLIKTKIKGSKKSSYDLRLGESDDSVVIKDIGKVFENPTEGEFTRMISLTLRHGAPIQYVVEQLQKDEESDMYSFSKVIARVLKKYIPEGAVTSETCPSCGSKIVYIEGCKQCQNCAWSKC